MAVTLKLPKFHEVASKTTFNAMAKDDATLYFIKDSQQVYKGTSNVTDSVILVNSFDSFLATSAFENKLYVSKDTKEAKVLVNGELITISGQGKIDLTGYAHDPTLNASTFTVTIPLYGKNDFTFELGRFNKLISITYDPKYTFSDGTGNALVYITSDYNQVQSTNVVDLRTLGSNKIDKIDVSATSPDGHITVFNSTGGVKDSGYTISNSTTLGSNANVIPNEQAVANAIKASGGIGPGNTDEIVISTTEGIVRSGKSIGATTLDLNTPNNKVATESAVLDIMSWKSI